MVKPAFIPERGDVCWIDFDPQKGREQAGRRPGLVLSRSQFNGRAMLAVVCPITSKSKKYPFEMPIPRGLKVKGVVLTDQIKCIDWTTRDLRPLTRLPAGFVDQVSRRVSQLIS